MPTLTRLMHDGDRARAISARDEAVATMSALAPMTRIVELGIPAHRAATVDRHDLGLVSLIRLTGFDYEQIATAKTTDGVPPGISLAIRPSGTWTLSQDQVTRSSAAGDVIGVVDVTRAMRLQADADTELLQLYLSADQLGFAVDELRVMAGTLERSPLRALVADHVLGVSRSDVDTLPAGALRSLGAATVELVRAMLLGAVRPEDRVGTTMGTHPLRTSVERYVRQHLHDPALSPATIAGAHSVSLRHLYNIWGDERATISRWIVQQRLAAIRDSLADPRQAHRPIAAIARDWCITNATYLSRRFHEEYGCTPREWRRTAGRPS